MSISLLDNLFCVLVGSASSAVLFPLSKFPFRNSRMIRDKKITSHVQFLLLLEAVISYLFYVTLLKLSASAWGTFAMDIVSEFSQDLKDKTVFGVDLHWTWSSCVTHRHR